MDIHQRLREIQNRIAQSAIQSGRNPDEITFLGVTKTVPVENILKAYEAGLREFGENRVQESLEKIPRLPANIRWHLIGQLQTNKINKTIGKFALIQSVDSFHLGEGLSHRVEEEKPQDILLEVNTSGEISKAGISPELAVDTAEKISFLSGLKLRGLMTVGPLTEDKILRKRAFQKLRELFLEIKEKTWAGPDFKVLSMGMSSDFEIAIQEGSTLIRIGTALFGERK